MPDGGPSSSSPLNRPFLTRSPSSVATSTQSLPQIALRQSNDEEEADPKAVGLNSSAISLPLGIATTQGLADDSVGKKNATDQDDANGIEANIAKHVQHQVVGQDEQDSIKVPFTTRVFIGPHLTHLANASDDNASQDTLDLQRSQARIWHRALVKGHEGHAAKKDAALNFAGRSFVIGAHEADTYRHLVMQQRRQESSKTSAKQEDEAKSENLSTSSETSDESEPKAAVDIPLKSAMKQNGSAIPREPVGDSSRSPTALLGALKMRGLERNDGASSSGQVDQDAQATFLTNEDGDRGRLVDSPLSSIAESSSRVSAPGVTFYTPMSDLQNNANDRHAGDLPARPPEEVLARAEPDLGVRKPNQRLPFKRKQTAQAEVVTREEDMLFASAWTKSMLPANFNDTMLRKYEPRMKNWMEVRAIWTGNRIEFYKSRNGRTPKLINTIGLSAVGVQLSLFTAADYTICISCPEVSRRRYLVNRMKHFHQQNRSSHKSHLEVHDSTQGTALFYLRPKITTNAIDWYFALWRHLGFVIPEVLDVHVPKLGMRITIPVPTSWDEAAQILTDRKLLENLKSPWQALTTEHLIKECLSTLTSIQQFKALLNGCNDNGWEPHLAWRRGDFLDVLFQAVDIDGRERPSPVLAGFALSQRFMSIADGLELRMMMPYPKSTRIAHRAVLTEPEGVEGFVTRVHGANQRERLYMASIGPNVYLTPASQSAPPEPPFQSVLDASFATPRRAGLFGSPYSIDKSEAKRLEFLRTVLMQRKLAKSAAKVTSSAYVRIDNDIRPEDVVKHFRAGEKSRLMHLIANSRGFIDIRNFELIEVTKATGAQPGVMVQLPHKQHLQFECSSQEVADEWLNRLTNLRKYWMARKEEDARQQIALHRESDRPTEHYVAPRDRRFSPYKDSFEEDDSFLSLAYNLSLARGDPAHPYGIRLYWRRAENARFKQRRCIIIGAHLFMFRTLGHTFDGKPVFPVFYHRRKTLRLQDCYVVTGSLCGEWRRHQQAQADGYSAADPGGARRPRVYADTLTSADSEEDCMFALWQNGKPSRLSAGQPKPIVHVFLARSRLERDQAVFVINTEIERAARESREAR